MAALDQQRKRIGVELEALEHARAKESVSIPASADAPVTMASPTANKITLFRNLFRGREDVFPRRWENLKSDKAGYAPACRNEWVRGICGKPQVKCGECPNQAFIPVSDDVIRAHLAGQVAGKPEDFTAGVYPMLPDETCWFLAADFDKVSWMDDVAAFRDTARSNGVPIDCDCVFLSIRRKPYIKYRFMRPYRISANFR